MNYFERVPLNTAKVQDARTIAPGERTYVSAPEEDLPAPETGWMDAAAKPPGEADADEFGCVVVWHLYNGCMVAGWKQARDNPFMTHWQPCPSPPAHFRELRARMAGK